ncbi:hypothetical protein [Hyphomicrobium sp.]|uniref:hypothetical protein n=1 Tax=Hyphomicrobium sp. TaxID=82 RepID=UPI0025BBCA7F|nr:hypothetical protein [Hyphomicrobium sp.]MCC7252603.1 hypothetical protein [Hyphomicrobium sp.]
MLLALVTIVCLSAAFFLAKGTQFLMPGPLTSAHGAIETCSACHTKSGSGKLSWVHGFVAGDRLADSKACLACHKMPDTAFNAHGASAEVLKSSTERLTKIAAETPVPQSARAQSVAFPTDGMVAHGLACATCHQEHQGIKFNLNKISNEQCRSCHVVKFDSFDGNHPKFDNYPFKRRTRIVYDHAGHFGKHYPELAKKDPARRIPETCSTCHDSRQDKRIMAVARFEQTCATCHLDQIVGKERATGPKGIAFLSLPGLDLDALKKKKAPIGEWPGGSEAELTPFMKVMISRNDKGRALIKAVDGLNLQDLANASDVQIKAVTDLVWEVKHLFHALISGKASDVLGDLNIVSGAKLAPGLVADLTASIPRDVVISAHKQWLPNLAKEIANGPIAGDPQQVISEQEHDDGPSSATADSDLSVSDSSEEPSDPDALETALTPDAEASDSDAAGAVKRDPPPCIVHLFGQCLMFKDQPASPAQPEGAAGQTGKGPPSASALPEPMRAGLEDAGPAAEPDAAAGRTIAAKTTPDVGQNTPSADDTPQAKAGDQSDDLLFPTEEELRAMKGRGKGTGKAAAPEGGGPAPPDPEAGSSTPGERLQPTPAPVIAIQSDVDPESWAEYGGWYTQDHAIFYRPTGHKDKFIYAWLFLTGPQAPKGGTSPAAAVFDFLTSKDAQGSCTKCHSVDDIDGKGRVVNFSPTSVESRQGRFTTFIHEPHFGLMEDRGCLTCHNLEKGRPYLTSYEHGKPQNFVSSFSAVKEDLCQSCHTAGMARQDCLLCHQYHVNGVNTPIMKTRLPTQ